MIYSLIKWLKYKKGEKKMWKSVLQQWKEVNNKKMENWQKKKKVLHSEKRHHTEEKVTTSGYCTKIKVNNCLCTYTIPVARQAGPGYAWHNNRFVKTNPVKMLFAC